MNKKMLKTLALTILLSCLLLPACPFTVYAATPLVPSSDCTLYFDKRAEATQDVQADYSNGDFNHTTGPIVGTTSFYNLTGVKTLSFKYTIELYRWTQWNDSSASASASIKLQLLDQSGHEQFSTTFSSSADNATYTLDVSNLIASGKNLSNVKIVATPSASAGASNDARGIAKAYMEQAITCKLGKPSIQTNVPTSKTYNYYESISLSVSAVGASPMSYQWYKDGSAISGATSSTYNLGRQTDLSNNGKKFYCKITNSAGTVNSSTCTLTANTTSFKPSISAPTTHTESYKYNTAITLTVSGTVNGYSMPSGTTYQWYKNGSAISGATKASYTFPAQKTPSTENGSKYYCKVTFCGQSANTGTVTFTPVMSTFVPKITASSLTTGNAIGYGMQDIVVHPGITWPVSVGTQHWIMYNGTTAPAANNLINSSGHYVGDANLPTGYTKLVSNDAAYNKISINDNYGNNAGELKIANLDSTYQGKYICCVAEHTIGGAQSVWGKIVIDFTKCEPKIKMDLCEITLLEGEKFNDVSISANFPLSDYGYPSMYRWERFKKPAGKTEADCFDRTASSNAAATLKVKDAYSADQYWEVVQENGLSYLNFGNPSRKASITTDNDTYYRVTLYSGNTKGAGTATGDVKNVRTTYVAHLKVENANIIKLQVLDIEPRNINSTVSTNDFYVVYWKSSGAQPDISRGGTNLLIYNAEYVENGKTKGDTLPASVSQVEARVAELNSAESVDSTTIRDGANKIKFYKLIEDAVAADVLKKSGAEAVFKVGDMLRYNPGSNPVEGTITNIESDSSGYPIYTLDNNANKKIKSAEATSTGKVTYIKIGETTVQGQDLEAPEITEAKMNWQNDANPARNESVREGEDATVYTEGCNNVKRSGTLAITVTADDNIVAADALNYRWYKGDAKVEANRLKVEGYDITGGTLIEGQTQNTLSVKDAPNIYTVVVVDQTKNFTTQRFDLRKAWDNTAPTAQLVYTNGTSGEGFSNYATLEIKDYNDEFPAVNSYYLVPIDPSTLSKESNGTISDATLSTYIQNNPINWSSANQAFVVKNHVTYLAAIKDNAGNMVLLQQHAYTRGEDKKLKMTNEYNTLNPHLFSIDHLIVQMPKIVGYVVTEDDDGKKWLEVNGMSENPENLLYSVNNSAYQTSNKFDITGVNERVSVALKDEADNVVSKVINLKEGLISDIDGTEIAAITRTPVTWSQVVTINVDVLAPSRVYDGANIAVVPKNSTNITYESKNTWDVTENGYYDIYIKKADPAAAPFKGSIQIDNVDKTAPTLSSDIAFDGYSTFTINAQDGQSGVRFIEYTVTLPNGTTTDKITVGAPDAYGTLSTTKILKITQKGKYKFYVTDHAENVYESGLQDVIPKPVNPDLPTPTPGEETPILSNVTFDVETTDWTNDSVDVTIVMDKTGLDPSGAFSWDGGVTWSNNDTYSVKTNGEYVVYVKDQFGNKYKTNPVKISNIDKHVPDVDISINNQKCTITFIDEGGSGLKSYTITPPDGNPITRDNLGGSNKEVYELTLSSKGKYTIDVNDVAGNKHSTYFLISNIKESDTKTTTQIRTVKEPGDTVYIPKTEYVDKVVREPYEVTKVVKENGTNTTTKGKDGTNTSTTVKGADGTNGASSTKTNVITKDNYKFNDILDYLEKHGIDITDPSIRDRLQTLYDAGYDFSDINKLKGLLSSAKTNVITKDNYKLNDILDYLGKNGIDITDPSIRDLLQALYDAGYDFSDINKLKDLLARLKSMQDNGENAIRYIEDNITPAGTAGVGEVNLLDEDDNGESKTLASPVLARNGSERSFGDFMKKTWPWFLLALLVAGGAVIGISGDKLFAKEGADNKKQQKPTNAEMKAQNMSKEEEKKSNPFDKLRLGKR